MLRVWDLMIESDEGYWILTLRTEDCEGDSPCEFQFQLPPDMAEQLHKRAGLEIGPWLAEKEAARASLASRTTVRQVQDELDCGVYDDDPAKRVWAERVVSGEYPL